MVEKCPDPAQLEQMLAQALPDELSSRVAAHIETCESCQSHLDDILQDNLGNKYQRSKNRDSNGVEERFLASMRKLAPSLTNTSKNALGIDTSPRVESRTEEELPTFIGEYEILGEIGRGGMSVVYKARQPRLGRIVAIKRLRIRDQNEADLTRFRREAEVLAGVPHRNILQIHECGEVDGRPFLALEYVPGGSLAEHLHGAPAKPNEAAILLGKIANAVHHAHQHGVIHRDLKPANILLADSVPNNLAACEPKVADFGLARRIDDDRGLTQPEMLAGTPAYLAPEQVSARAGKLTEACDIHALGVLLYEMLTGRPPLMGPTVLETLRLVENTEPLPPRRLQPHIPRDLETICLKCLHKDPSRRYATAKDVADDLKRFLEKRPIRARRVSRMATAWRWSRRNPVLAALAIALLVSLSIGIAATIGFVQEARHNEKVAREQATQLLINSRLANDRTYVSDLRLASSMWSSRQLDLLTDLLEGQLPKRADGIDRRGFEWHYLWRASHPPHRTLTKLNTAALSVAFGKDSKRIAVAGGDHRIRVLEMGNGNVSSTLTGLVRPIVRMAWASQGNLIAAVTDDGVLGIWDAATGKSVGSPHAFRQLVRNLDFNHSGESIAVALRDGHVQVLNCRTGAVIKTLGGPEVGLVSVAFDHRGHQLAAGCRDGTIRVWDASTWMERPPMSGHLGEIICLAFSPDDSLLATGSVDHSIRLWQPESGRVYLAVTHHTDAVTDVAFSPDGQWLASASIDRTLRVVEVATNSPMPPLLGHTGPITSIAFSPGGGSLATSSLDKTVRVWDVPNLASDRRLTGHTKPVQAAATDALDRFFVTAAIDGEIRVWDPTSFAARLVLLGPKEGITNLAVNPDSGEIAASGVDRKIYRWNSQTGEPLPSLIGHNARVECLDYSSDGARLVSGGADQWVRIWDVASGELLKSLENARKVKSIAWHPSKELVAAGDVEGNITVYDIATGLAIQRLVAVHKGGINGVAFSPDGRHLASAGEDRLILLWNLDDWTKRETLRGHISAVKGVRFGPDSRRLFSVGLDATVRVWNAADGQPLLVLVEPTPMSALAVSSNGLVLIAGGKSGLVRVWNATPSTP